MFDIRPVGYVIGMLVAALGVVMLLPMAIDLLDGNDHWTIFFESALITCSVGGLVALACANGVGDRLSLQQTFLLSSGVWLALPIFGAIPFMLGETNASAVDGFFEAMSGLTTTGSTVFSGLDVLPRGLLLWRALLQWIGGIGVIVMAMVFLPELRIGGMQMFRSEAFDTMGKILPRATEIASSISVIYVGLTVLCALVYLWFGMSPFDAVCHAMTTISTGGFANYDASFGAFNPNAEFASTFFMIVAALPFVRYVQMLGGAHRPFFRDSQIRTFLALIFGLFVVLSLWRWGHEGEISEPVMREVIFNVVSIISGTGYASDNYMLWGTFPVVMFFFIGLIGGCAGSTACSVKVFRYQILFSAIKTQIQRIHSPNGVFTPRYDGQPVAPDVLGSVMAFFMLFFVSLGVFSVLLGMTGLSFITSVSGAATALANVGPGLGAEIGPAGNFATLNTTAKWLLAFAMWIGRLELMVVYAIFTANFWRA
ncbi:Trk system potassium uptake protein TrkG [Pseudoruegeria aquimaris]|uniref:Trk system potassium uptake protein n=1 Tax=Pseudoruegeria aquimaris TaxID=393663 RepID=A0A1Y5SMR7_9RHOB|nr:TrkH family potassium uptake protein [Pseudoruegeria aquimaris]SLN41336.1 Trk system potassium uptake protein TrkG [Pseudoruegeria aquimaris]